MAGVRHVCWRRRVIARWIGLLGLLCLTRGGYGAGPALELLGQTGGSCVVVTMDDRYAYVGEGACLTILDLDSPLTSPQLALPVVSRTLLTGDIGEIALLDGRLACVADGSGLQLVDVSNRAAPVIEGRLPVASNRAWNVAAADGRAYLTDTFLNSTTTGTVATGHLTIVDVRNPAAPVQLGQYAFQDATRGVAVGNGRAYVASGGLQILDVTNPTAPARLGGIDLPVGGGRVAVAGNLACFTGDGLRLVDVSDPAAPRPRGRYQTFNLAVDVKIMGHLALLSDRLAGLHVVDITDPDTPRTAAIYGDAHWVFSVAAAGNRAAVGSAMNGLHVLNLDQPTTPRLVGRYEPLGPVESSRAVAVRDRWAYVADFYIGLRVFDVSQPAAPSLIRTLRLPLAAQAGKVVLGDRLAVFTTGRDETHLLDLTDPTSPTRRVTLPIHAPGAALDGSMLYVATEDYDLRVYDASDPASPTLRGRVALGTYPHDLALSGGLAYVAGSEGLRIFDVHDPAHPVFRGDYATSFSVVSVKVVDRRAYLPTDDQVMILDVGDPAAPRLLGTCPGPNGQCFDVAVAGRLVYVSGWSLMGGNGFVRVFDASDPTAPVEVGSYPTPTRASSVTATAGTVYVTDNMTGLYLLRSPTGWDAAGPSWGWYP